MRATEIDETPLPAETPREYVLRLADEKARAVHIEASEIVLAADTTVVLGNEILGKPADDADAVRMLTALAGRSHDVLTGICVLRGDGWRAADVASTTVWFNDMTNREIAAYVASGEPQDKAGSYAVQGLASRWVSRIDGSYANVVGLPVAMVYDLLREAGCDL